MDAHVVAAEHCGAMCSVHATSKSINFQSLDDLQHKIDVQQRYCNQRSCLTTLDYPDICSKGPRRRLPVKGGAQGQVSEVYGGRNLYGVIPGK